MELGGTSSTDALVLGTTRRGERRVESRGGLSVPEDAVFEIGSVTKVFTALLLALMAEAKLVRFDDPVSKYLSRWPVFAHDGVTLEQLAMHTSGLRRMPLEWFVRGLRGWTDPYGWMTDRDVDRAISRMRSLRRHRGTLHYSNLGYVVLGRALEVASGSSFSSMVHDELCTPLGLSQTFVESSQPNPNMLQGYSVGTVKIPSWPLLPVAPAGGLRSTAPDLILLLDALLQPAQFPALESALENVQHARRLSDGTEVGLGWHAGERDGVHMWAKNGSTGGFGTFIAFSRAANVGAVVLSNHAFAKPVEDLCVNTIAELAKG